MEWARNYEISPIVFLDVYSSHFPFQTGVNGPHLRRPDRAVHCRRAAQLRYVVARPRHVRCQDRARSALQLTTNFTRFRRTAALPCQTSLVHSESTLDCQLLVFDAV